MMWYDKDEKDIFHGLFHKQKKITMMNLQYLSVWYL